MGKFLARLLLGSLIFTGAIVMAQSTSQVSTLVCGSNVQDWLISGGVTPSPCIEVTVVCGRSRGRNVAGALISGNFRAHQAVIADLITQLRGEEGSKKAQIQAAIDQLQRRDKRETEICQFESAPKATPAPVSLATPNVIVPSLVLTAMPVLTGTVTTASTNLTTPIFTPTHTVTHTSTSTFTASYTLTMTSTVASTMTSTGTPTHTPTPIPYAPYVSGDGSYGHRAIVSGVMVWPTATP
jgi:hypothetical protein